MFKFGPETDHQLQQAIFGDDDIDDHEVERMMTWPDVDEADDHDGLFVGGSEESFPNRKRRRFGLVLGGCMFLLTGIVIGFSVSTSRENSDSTTSSSSSDDNEGLLMDRTNSPMENIFVRTTTSPSVNPTEAPRTLQPTAVHTSLVPTIMSFVNETTLATNDTINPTALVNASITPFPNETISPTPFRNESMTPTASPIASNETVSPTTLVNATPTATLIPSETVSPSPMLNASIAPIATSFSNETVSPSPFATPFSNETTTSPTTPIAPPATTLFPNETTISPTTSSSWLKSNATTTPTTIWPSTIPTTVPSPLATTTPNNTTNAG